MCADAHTHVTSSDTHKPSDGIPNKIKQLASLSGATRYQSQAGFGLLKI